MINLILIYWLNRLKSKLVDSAEGIITFFKLQYPKHGKSQEDELVAEYVHQELRKYVEPWVALPDLHHVTSVQAEDNVEVVSVTLPDLHHVTSVQAEDNVEVLSVTLRMTPDLCVLDKVRELFVLIYDLFSQNENKNNGLINSLRSYASQTAFHLI